MQTKYKMPADVRLSIISIVKGQSRRELEYRQKKSDILQGGGAKYITYENPKTHESHRLYLPGSNSNKSVTEIKALALNSLENDAETKRMIAVQQALVETVNDIDDIEQKHKIQSAILNNINDRRRYPYRFLYLPGISKEKFYMYKSKFIYTVAKKLNFL